MMNRKAGYIRSIERALNDKQLSEIQRQTLVDFDRFNELESQCRLSTRLNYIRTVVKLGKYLRELNKNYEQATREDLQTFISLMKQHHKDGMVQLIQTHLKRFYRWIEWKRVNEELPEEQKLEITDVKTSYCARWMKPRFNINDIEFEDLPTDEEVKRIAENIKSQRDRAMFLTLWETGCSPIELLNLRIKDVRFNQYGAIVIFPRYTDPKTKQTNELKTEFRYRQIPIATSVPDLQLWITMHPKKEDSNAPLWWSQRGGGISYQQLVVAFRFAKRKAGVTKKLTLYSFRHKRLSQVGNVLSPHELKKFAGHSRNSNVTPRYLHEDDKSIERKILKERGVEVKEETVEKTALTVKICPRCKHQNSPTFKFCAMCSMPLDMETMFEVQKKGELMSKGSFVAIDDEEYNKLMNAFAVLQQNNPKLFKELNRRFWEMVAVELMKPQIKT